MALGARCRRSGPVPGWGSGARPHSAHPASASHPHSGHKGSVSLWAAGPAQSTHPAKAQASGLSFSTGEGAVSGRWWPPAPGSWQNVTPHSCREVDSSLEEKLDVRSPVRQGPTSQSALSKINSAINIRHANVC